MKKYEEMTKEELINLLIERDKTQKKQLADPSRVKVPDEKLHNQEWKKKIQELEKALNKSEEKFNAIMEMLPDVISIIDANSNIIYTSPAGKKLHGYSREEIIGEKVYHIMHPEDATSYMEIFNKHFAEPDKIHMLQFRRLCKDGSYKWVEAVGYNQLHNPLINGIITVTRDISKRMEAEEELYFTKYIVENSIHAIVWTDYDGNIVYANKKTCSLSGYTKEELLQMKIFDINLDLNENIYHKFWEKIKHTGAGIYQRVYTRKDGTKLPGELVTNYMNYGKKEYLCGFVLDITERKKMENELQLALEAKDKLFSIISHDIRAPIGNMSNFINILLSEPFDNKDIMEDLKKLDELAKVTYSLIENLLLWATTHGEKLQTNPQQINLKDLLREIIVLLKINASHKNIDLEIDMDDNICVYADREMLKTILRNLISNAIKFTKKSGKIKISATRKDDYAECSISDNGIGISEENLKKIFDKNIYFSTFGTNNERGTGIGLSLCREFIEKNGGKLLVKSEEGKGSEFIFTAPLRNSNLKILLVESNPDNRNTYKYIIEKSGHNVETADNGLDAIEILNNKSFNIVFMDIEMPDMNGIETYKTIKIMCNKNFSTPIIALIEKEGPEAKSRCVEAGMDIFIYKPLNEESFLKCLERFNL